MERAPLHQQQRWLEYVSIALLNQAISKHHVDIEAGQAAEAAPLTRMASVTLNSALMPNGMFVC